MADGWTPLEGVENVYYRSVTASDADRTFGVIADDEVTVKGDVTKEMLNNLNEDTNPTLTFTAYAVQSENMADAATAWSSAEF